METIPEVCWLHKTPLISGMFQLMTFSMCVYRRGRPGEEARSETTNLLAYGALNDDNICPSVCLSLAAYM